MNESLLKETFPYFSKGLLEEISEKGTIREVTEGEQIMERGGNIRHTTLVLDGLIKIYREDEQDHEFFVYHLYPGQACAMSIACGLYNKKYPIRAIAVQDSKLLSIPFNELRDWMKRYPEWVEYVIGTYRDRFDDLLNAFDQVAFLKLDERLWRYLMKMIEAEEEAGLRSLQISHQVIADDLNTSREVISRMLKKMEQQGILKIHRNRLDFNADFFTLGLVKK